MARKRDLPNAATVKAVTEILAKLPVAKGKRVFVEPAAEEIVEIAEVVTECLPHKLKSVGTAAAQKAIARVAGLAGKLAASLDALPKEAIKGPCPLGYS